MTGNELTEWIEVHGLNQQIAADILGISRTTLHHEKSKGSQQVSSKVSSAAINYAIVRAKNDLGAAFIRLNSFLNHLATSGGS